MQIIIKNIITLFLLCFITSVYPQTTIEGISFKNYPRVDGSVSFFSLNKVIACKILNIEYEWKNERGRRYIVNQYVNRLINTSPTNQVFINLIENKTDIIFATRKISVEEKKHADSLGIELIETPIALDALVFLVHEERGIKSLTTQQIQDIYTDKIDRWETLGGDSGILYPYIRDNYLSEISENMEDIVMKGMQKKWDNYFTIDYMPRGRDDIFTTMSKEHQYAICFFLYGNEIMLQDQLLKLKSLFINDIEPNSETITNRTYPYVSEVYVVIRSDLPKNSFAYKLYEWLQTKEGQAVIKESGYIPIKN